jgi:hypothetical protein
MVLTQLAVPLRTTDYHGVLKALGRTIDGDKPGYNPFTHGVKMKLKYRYIQDHGKESVRKSGGKHSDAMVPQDHMVIMAKVLEEALALVSGFACIGSMSTHSG